MLYEPNANVRLLSRLFVVVVLLVVLYELFTVELGVLELEPAPIPGVLDPPP